MSLRKKDQDTNKCTKKTKEFKVMKALSENENNQSDTTFLCFTATQFLLKIRQISTPFPVFTNVTF